MGYNVAGKCDRCTGAGFLWEETKAIKCPLCGGSGTVDKRKLTEQEERELNAKLIAITQEVNRRTGQVS